MPRRGVALAAGLAALWLVAVAAEVVLTVSDILGLPLGQAADPTMLRSFLGQTSQGRALLVQVALLVVVAGLARSAATDPRRPGRAAGRAWPRSPHRR